MPDQKQYPLYKSSDNRIFTGVAAGLAEFFEIDPMVIRVLFILLGIANGVGVVLYIVLSVSLSLSLKPSVDDSESDESLQADIESIQYQESVVEPHQANLQDDLRSRRNILSFVLIIVGMVFLSLKIDPWLLIPPTYQIPILVIIGGVSLIFKSIINNSSSL